MSAIIEWQVDLWYNNCGGFMQYTPFYKNNKQVEFNNIEYEDLNILKEITEGFCIEYKSEYVPSVINKKIPQSITSFSNDRGGWLFVGVSNDGQLLDIEKPKGDIYESICQSISSKVFPFPKFVARFIDNPNKPNYGIIVCQIFRGTDKPYVYDGTIYVRAGNINDPQPASRPSIDLMYRESLGFSNLKVKCCYSEYENQFILTNKHYSDFKPRCIGVTAVKTLDKFREDNQLCLYIENCGKHFDEDIEVTISFNKECYIRFWELLDLNKGNFEFYEKFLPIEKSVDINAYPDYKNRVVETPPIKYASQPIGMGMTVPTTYTDENDIEYLQKETQSIIEQKYCYDILVKDNNIYMSFRLNKISPNEKIFFPSYIFVNDDLSEINYTIKSKYSFENEKGQLILKK